MFCKVRLDSGDEGDLAGEPELRVRAASCELLGVSVSGNFEHQRRQQRRRPSQPGSGRLSDEASLAHMRAIHAEVRQE
jgi:hypothetical protein